MSISPGIYAGAAVRVTFEFEDSITGALATPEAPYVAAWRKVGSSSWTDFTVTVISAGVLEGVFVAAGEGTYAATCKSSGSEPAVGYGEVVVLPTGR